ncbi:MAG: PhoH family protein [Candidatus Kinetoplastibacterium crithidii]|nr:MAG: PhoH family protein [Candidatus Kinetoplastibacterium crithidii]
MQNNISKQQTDFDQIIFEETNANFIISRLCGPLDINIKILSDNTNTSITRVGNIFKIQGQEFLLAKKALYSFYEQAKTQEIMEQDIFLGIKEIRENEPINNNSEINDQNCYNDFFNFNKFKPKSTQQYKCLDNIYKNIINFSIGPAGTGKTMLAIICAIRYLELGIIKKILLTRPAVEAGEKLGFLPGDLTQKIDPYLRPLYDILYEFIGAEKVQKLVEKQIIEIAPLAYMRGRTLNNSFIILDESQNTTPEQMKMFLTRIGFHSKAVITGDPSQIDLQKGQKSGLNHAISILNNIDGISITRFTQKDIMRHPLVSKIVEAYDKS